LDPNANLTLIFSEAIKRGMGSIELRTNAGALVETFANGSPRVSIAGSTLTVDPTAPLAGNTNYRLILASDAVTDLSGNVHGAFSAPAFTTAPVEHSMTPSGGLAEPTPCRAWLATIPSTAAPGTIGWVVVPEPMCSPAAWIGIPLCLTPPVVPATPLAPLPPM
jgi:hypothetical protein